MNRHLMIPETLFWHLYETYCPLAPHYRLEVNKNEIKDETYMTMATPPGNITS